MKEEWKKIFEIIETTITVMGVIGNLGLLLLLAKKRLGSKMATTFFRSQAFLDLMVSVVAIILMKQPPMWRVESDIVSAMICYVWHSQFVYWMLVFMSVQNIVLIGLERFWAVTRPLFYKNLRTKHTIICFAILGAYTVVVTPGGAVLARFENGSCTGQKLAFDGDAVVTFILAHSVVYFTTMYFIPVCTLIFLYTNIIITLRKSLKIGQGSSDVVKDRAAMRFIKIAMIITVIFIVSLSFDTNYYLFGSIGVTVYEVGSSIQKVGLIMVSLNSACNPYVYFFFTMLASLKRLCQKKRQENSSTMVTSN